MQKKFISTQEGFMADSYQEVSPADFQEKVLQASQLVLTLFVAGQSNTCQIQEPEFEVISKEFEGRALFTKVSLDDQSELTNQLVSQWKIEGVPTIIFFRNGQEIYRVNGIIMRERLRRQLEGVLLTQS
jgi:thioredoxin 1